MNNSTKFKANPYNFSNKLVTKQDVIDILHKVNMNDFQPKTISFYQEAFIHKSYCRKNDPFCEGEIVDKPDNVLQLMDKSNETLEFLGDSVLNCVVADYLHERYPGQDEGFLTKIRTRIVNGTTLSKFSQELDLSNFLVISRHVEDKCNGRNNPRILEDIFEAFIGSIYLDNTRSASIHEDNHLYINDKMIINNPIKNIHEKTINDLLIIGKKSRSTDSKRMINNIINDLKKANTLLIDLINNNANTNTYGESKANEYNRKGFEICKKFIINVIEENVDFTDLIRIDNNYKDQLLRYFQHRFQEVPKYIEILCDGPPHDRKFTMGVMNSKNKIIGQATEKTKKKAEQMASKQALFDMKVITHN